MDIITEINSFPQSVPKILNQEDMDETLFNAAPQALANRTRFLYEMLSQAGMKTPCACATTGNIALAGLQIIDGVQLVAGQSVLVKAQNNLYENGIYVAAADAWSRRFDNDSTADMNMSATGIISGTTLKSTIWLQTTANPAVGTSGIVWEQAYPLTFDKIANKPNTVTGYGITDMYLYAPPGSVTAFAGGSAPAGWLECNGASVSRTAYPALYAVIGTTYGSVDGNTFNLPDLRGEFIRGHDHGRGIDTGRVVGTAQQDAIQNIVGKFGIDDRSNQLTPTGAFSFGEGTNCGSEGGGSGTSLIFDASRVVRTADETRPRNVAMLYIIKI